MSFREWFDALQDILGFDLLAELLNVSRKKLFKYDADFNSMPQEIATRTKFLIELVSVLAGAYNDEGIRQWFSRERVQLKNKHPLQILTGNWNPQGAEPQKILSLARNINS